ncbi:hypothetical protein E3N88_34040 [Mikania micrantha]|uniref:Reverse transcriptase zinc-binding domain-containing protein n=1 Tax=Mikania micrantha TaxID=192012 RepID=A0A5N6MD06_9ASTR|nr:hypothetical protein E3N88_34040 [Mikania micrantha]
MKLIKCDVGSGSSAAFWADTWLGDAPLKVLFPALFGLDRCKKCKVSDRLTWVDGEAVLNWNWVIRPATREVTEEMEKCMEIVSNTQQKHGPDRWIWCGDSNGVFNVKSKVTMFIVTRND